MEPNARPDEEFNFDFDINEEVPVHEKCPDMMPMLGLPKKATRPPVMEMPPPKPVDVAARCNEPGGENELSDEEDKVPPRRSSPRRSGRGAAVVKKPVVNKKRGRAKRAEV
jgi:hypothetical protein